MSKHLKSNFVAKHGTELQEFFHEAALHGYGSNRKKNGRAESSEVLHANGSTQICYQRDGWMYVDTYFGGEPFSGITIVYHHGIACLSMVYWGKVLPHANQEAVYDCLRPALMASRPEHPWRGPNHFDAANGLSYTNLWHGTIEKFYGQEKIGDSLDNWLYEADYRGGVINLR